MAAAEVPAPWPKPLDVGNGQVCASFTVDGSWLSLGCPHPARGFVELTGAPAFEEAWRGQPDAVRRYRQELTLAANAALRLTGVPEVVPDPGPSARPRCRARTGPAATRPRPGPRPGSPPWCSVTAGGPEETRGLAG